MPLEVPYPCPKKFLLMHPAFGPCFFTEDNKLHSATHGGKIITTGVDLTRGWTALIPSKDKAMFHVFDVKLQDGTQTKVGASAPTEKEAQQLIRAKLGLDHNTELKCCDCVCDANTATFDELKKAATMKRGGDDSPESMQQNVPQGNQPQGQVQPINSQQGLQDPKLQVPRNPSVPNQGGQSPAQSPTDPSAPRIPPEKAPGDTMHPDGQGQPTGNQG